LIDAFYGPLEGYDGIDADDAAIEPLYASNLPFVVGNENESCRITAALALWLIALSCDSTIASAAQLKARIWRLSARQGSRSAHWPRRG
jgi:hypothetical protein